MGVVRSIHIKNEETLYKALRIAEKLRYRSFSDFVESLLEISVEVYEKYGSRRWDKHERRLERVLRRVFFGG